MFWPFAHTAFPAFIGTVVGLLGTIGTAWRMAWSVIRAVKTVLDRAEKLAVRLENHMKHDEASLEAILRRLETQDKALMILVDRTKNL